MAHEDIRLDGLVESLLLWFPILRTTEYAGILYDLKPGPYLIFGSSFTKYVEDMASPGHVEERAVIGQFIEHMVAAGDRNIDELLRLELFPVVLKSQRIVDAYWQHLGANTQRCLWWVAPKLAPYISLSRLD